MGIDLVASYSMVSWACEQQQRLPLWVIPLGTLAATSAGIWMSATSWTRLRNGASESGGSVQDRSHFLALAGLAVNAVFVLLIVTTLIPRFLLDPCAAL